MQAVRGGPWEFSRRSRVPRIALPEFPHHQSGSALPLNWQFELVDHPRPSVPVGCLESTLSPDEHDLGQGSVEMYAVLTILRV